MWMFIIILKQFNVSRIWSKVNYIVIVIEHKVNIKTKDTHPSIYTCIRGTQSKTTGTKTADNTGMLRSSFAQRSHRWSDAESPSSNHQHHPHFRLHRIHRPLLFDALPPPCRDPRAARLHGIDTECPTAANAWRPQQPASVAPPRQCRCAATSTNTPDTARAAAPPGRPSSGSTHSVRGRNTAEPTARRPAVQWWISARWTR